MKKKHKLLLNYIYIGITLGIMLLIIVFNNTKFSLSQVLLIVDFKWILIACLCVLLFWISDAVLLKQITKYIIKKISFISSFKYSIIGLYYGALTPFASGGQPAQVLYMQENNISIGYGTSIVSLKFMAYEFSLCFLYLISMIFRGKQFYIEYNSMFWLTLLGFFINLIAVILIIMVAINERVAYNLTSKIILFLNKIKIIRKVDKYLDIAEKNINEFSSSINIIKHNKLNAFISFFLSCVNMFLLFIIPYFIYRGFSLNEYSFLDIFALESFLYLAVSFVPLPGASIAAEGGFKVFFHTIFGSGLLVYSLIIWRFLTFYLIIIVGSILVIVNQIKKLK